MQQIKRRQKNTKIFEAQPTGASSADQRKKLLGVEKLRMKYARALASTDGYAGSMSALLELPGGDCWAMRQE